MENTQTDTARGAAQMETWSPEQRDRACKAFAAFEAAEAGLAPGKPRYVHPTWGVFCQTVRDIRLERMSQSTRAVANEGGVAQYMRGNVGDPLPPVVPALKRCFAWNRPAGLIWTLPLT